MGLARSAPVAGDFGPRARFLRLIVSGRGATQTSIVSGSIHAASVPTKTTWSSVVLPTQTLDLSSASALRQSSHSCQPVPPRFWKIW